jgi:hypothetical protein
VVLTGATSATAFVSLILDFLPASKACGPSGLR